VEKEANKRKSTKQMAKGAKKRKSTNKMAKEAIRRRSTNKMAKRAIRRRSTNTMAKGAIRRRSTNTMAKDIAVYQAVFKRLPDPQVLCRLVDLISTRISMTDDPVTVVSR
jgi:tryptophan 2,3-dioxygenase